MSNPFRVAAVAILLGCLVLLLLTTFAAAGWRELPGICSQAGGLAERVFPKGGWSYEMDTQKSLQRYSNGQTTLEIEWRRNPNGGLCAWRWRVYEEA